MFRVITGICLSLLLLSFPVAADGILDLRGWDFDRDRIVRLDGPWEVYHQQLFEPADFSGDHPPKPDGYIHMPMVWDGRMIDGEPLNPKGYATFRIKILTGPSTQLLALRLSDIISAYRLWINGQLVSAAGIPGTDHRNEIPQQDLKLVQVINERPVLEIILQVSNQHYRYGGVISSPQLGTSRDIYRLQNIRWAVALFLVGCLVIMGIYHILIFLLRPRDASPLFCGFYCLLWAINALASPTADWFIHQLHPGVPWTVLYRIDLISAYLSDVVILYFLHCLFSHEISLRACRLILAVAVIFSLVTLSLPIRLFSGFVPLFFVITFLYIVYMLIKIILAIRRKRPGALIIFIGLGFLFVSGANDMLHDTNFIHTAYIMPLGVFAFILCQCLALSVKFSGAFTSVELLSDKLRRKNEALSRLNELKDEFLANTSHELRTPLNGMVGMAEALIADIGGKLSASAYATLETIAASGKRLGHLINDVLDFSRLKHRDVKLNRRSVDLRALTEVVLYVLRPLASNKSLILNNAIGADTPAVFADEDRLQQILYNLIGNAIKFTNKGSVQVSATVRDSFVDVSITDTGIGIPADRIPAVFESFEQEDTIHEIGFAGTGLGLPITQKLVALHGGTINVTSSVGEGSCFTFTIPISTTQPLEAVDTPASASSSGSGPGPEPLQNENHAPVNNQRMNRAENCMTSESVLAVDDDPVNLQVVANHLALASIPFATATDGREALSMIEQYGPPAMILLDIMMPGINGYDVCRKLRERFSSAELPIVLLTARNRLEDLIQGFEAGGNDYLTKPFSRDELIARVRSQLKIRKAYDLMRENIQLKREINQRRQTEQDLRVTQRRLTRMLDTIDAAVLAVNESNEICFCNRAFESMTGYRSEELLGNSLHTLLPFGGASELLNRIAVSRTDGGDSTFEKAYDITMHCPDRGRLGVIAEVTFLDLESEQLLMLIARETTMGEKDGPSPFQNRSTAVAFIDELNRNRRRLRDLENSLCGLTPLASNQNQEVIQGIKSIDNALAGLEQFLNPDGTKQDHRRLAVTLMNQTLEYWGAVTGMGKVALAQQSGLWKVYMDQNGWERTQTLDKYLDIRTLPKRPRWKLIVKTADFVLAACDQSSPLREQIEALQRKLRLQF